MKLRIILCIFLLSSCQFWVGIDGGKNQKKKSPKQKEILKEITTDLEICIQSDKNVDKKERMFVEFSNCLTNLKKPNLIKQFFEHFLCLLHTLYVNMLYLCLDSHTRVLLF